jgi:chromosome segregation ATPase
MAATEPDSYERVVSALKNLKRSNGTLEQECEQLRTELSELNDRKAALESELQDHNGRLATERTLELENEDLKARIRELEADHADDVEKQIDLRRVLEETVTQLCAERKTKARIEAKTAKITANIRALTQVAESLHANPDQIRENEQLAKRIEEKKDKWRRHKHELESMVTDLRVKRDELRENAKNYQLQIDDRTGLIVQLEAKVERRKKTIGELEQALVDRSDEEQRLVSELTRIRSEVETLKAQSQSLRDTLKQSVSTLSANRKRFEKEKEKLSTAKYQMKHLQMRFAEKLRVLREEGEQETKAKLDELQKIDAQRDEELRVAQAELAAAKEKHETATSVLKKLETERQTEKRKYAQAVEEFEARFQAMQKVILTFTQRPIAADDF